MPHAVWLRPVLVPLAAAAALVTACVPVSAAEPRLRLTLMERSAEGVCLYETAVRDMLVAVLVREQPGKTPCKPELMLP